MLIHPNLVRSFDPSAYVEIVGANAIWSLCSLSSSESAPACEGLVRIDSRIHVPCFTSRFRVGYNGI